MIAKGRYHLKKLPAGDSKAVEISHKIAQLQETLDARQNKRRRIEGSIEVLEKKIRKLQNSLSKAAQELSAAEWRGKTLERVCRYGSGLAENPDGWSTQKLLEEKTLQTRQEIGREKPRAAPKIDGVGDGSHWHY
jgi:chromosome segregation ATPase